MSKTNRLGVFLLETQLLDTQAQIPYTIRNYGKEVVDKISF